MSKDVSIRIKATDDGSRTVQKFSDNAASAFKKLAGPLAIGAATTALAAFTKQMIDYGDQLDKLSIRTGMAASTLDKLNHLAELSGNSLESVSNASKMLSKNIDLARIGSKQAADAFGELGISVDDLLKLTPEEQFLMIAEAIDKIENPTLKQATALKLMGRQAYDLITMFPNLRENLANTATTMDNTIASSMASFNDNMNTLKRNITQAFIPAIGALAQAFNVLFFGMESESENALKASRERIVATIEKLKAGASATGDALSDMVIDNTEMIKAYEEALKRVDDRLSEINKKKPKEGEGTKLKTAAEWAATGGGKKSEEETFWDDWHKMQVDSAIKADEEMADAYAGYVDYEKQLEKEKTEKFKEEQKARLEAWQRANDYMLSQGKNQSKMWETFGNNVSETFTDAFTNMITGTEDFADAFKRMAASIISDLIQIYIREQATKTFGGGGGIGGFFKSLATVGLGYFTSGAGTSLDGGTAFSSGVSMSSPNYHAKGGIVSTPTVVGMAGGGVAVAGEAGDEAVMPLTRTSSGDLAVKTAGGGGDTNIFITAVDAKSFSDYVRRNPQPLIKVVKDAIDRGENGIIQSIRRAK